MIRCYQQDKLPSREIKESSWKRLYKPRRVLRLKSAKGLPVVRDAWHWLEAQADLWRQRREMELPDRLQIQAFEAHLL